MPAKRKQVCFKKKIKRWHNACKTQANVLAFCQSLVEDEIERWKNACKTQANVHAFCLSFARVCLKKKLNAGKTPAERLQNASTQFSFLSRDTLAKRGDL